MNGDIIEPRRGIAPPLQFATPQLNFAYFLTLTDNIISGIISVVKKYHKGDFIMKKILSGFLVALFAVSMAIMPSKALAADVYAYTDPIEGGETYVMTETIEKLNDSVVTTRVKYSIWWNGKVSWKQTDYTFQNKNGVWKYKTTGGDWKKVVGSTVNGPTAANNILYIVLRHVRM